MIHTAARGWLVGLSLACVLVGCRPSEDESVSPESKFGEQGLTFKGSRELGPNILYPNSETAFISAFIERPSVSIQEYVAVCYRSFEDGILYDQKDDQSDYEINPKSSCARQSGGWKAIPFTINVTGLGEPADLVAFSAQEHWIYSYADPGDQTQPLTFKFDDHKLIHLRIKIAGLKSGARYELRILAGNKLFSNRVILQTPRSRVNALDAPATKFVALADLKTWDHNFVQLKVREQLARLFDEGRAHLAILPGDISNQAGTSAQYANTYFRTYGRLLAQMPFYPIHGNHDLFPLNLLGDVSQDGWHFFRMFQLPPNPEAEAVLHRGPNGKIDQSGYRAFYSFDWGKIHFIALDVPDFESPGFNSVGRGSVQYKWLKQDLENSADAQWRIVYFHQPIGNPDQRSADMDDLVALMYRNHVNLVISGHWEHPVMALNQENTPPWMVVPSGGARSRFYDRCPDKFGLVAFSVTENELSGQFINADGKTMGDFKLAKIQLLSSSERQPGVQVIQQNQGWISCEEK